MKSKLLSIVVLLLVLIVGGALIVPSFIDWNKYKSQIQQQVVDKTGYDISLNGDISLSVLPTPSVKIRDIVVKNNEQTLVDVASVHVSVQLLPLLSKSIKIDDVELVEPKINIAIDQDGKGNWESALLSSEKSEDKKVSEKKSEEASALKDFSVDDVNITNGTFTFANAQTDALHTLNAINVDAELESLEGPFKGDVSFTYQGKLYEFSGGVTSLQDMTKIPVDLAVKLDKGAVIASFNGTLNSTNQSALGAFAVKGDKLQQYAGTHASGPFEASGAVEYANQNVKLESLKASLAGLKFIGDISATGTESFSLNIKETTKASGQGTLGKVLSGSKVDAKISMKEKEVVIPSYNVVLQGSSLKGSGAYRFDGGVNLVLDADKIDLDKWMGYAPSGKVSGESASSKSVKTKDLGFDVPMKATVDVTVGTLIYEAKTYKNLKAAISTDENSVKISNVSLKMDHETDIAIKGTIANTKSLSGLDVKASLKTKDADALLKSLNVDREAYSQTIGSLEADAAINGSLSNLGFSAKLRNKGATITTSGIAKDPMGTRTLNDLSVRIQHANFIKAVQIAQPDFSMDRAWQKPLDVTVGLSMSPDTINVTSLKGKVGLIPVESGKLSIKTGGAVPSLSGNLSLGSVVLPKTESAKPSNSRGNSSKTKGSKWSGSVIDTSWMKSFEADLDLKAKKLEQNKWVFNNPQLDFNVKDGTLTVSQLKADMFNGSALLSAKAVSGQGNKGFANVNLNVDAQNLNAQSLYSAIKGQNSNMIVGLITKASENVTTSGVSMAELVANLTGSATVNGERIMINGVDITSFVRAASGDFRGLNSLKDISSSVLYKGKTEFTSLDGQFDIKQGIVNLSPVILDGPKAKFDVSGNLDLPKWTIDIKNAVSVKGDSDDVPPFEMSFRGSLDNPVKSAGGDALNNLVQRKIGKLLGDKDLTDKLNNKLGIDIFGGSKKNADDNSEDGAQKEPTAEDAINNAVGNALGGLLNGL